MKKKKINKKSVKKLKAALNLHASLELNNEFEKLVKRLAELEQFQEEADGRLQDLEIHVNLLTRLLTTLCVEKLGIRVGVLKRLIKRIEKEAIRDSQIMHLESLYKMPDYMPKPPKSSKPSSQGDPWEEIS